VTAETKLSTTNPLHVNYRATITIKVPDTDQCNLNLNTLNGNIIKSPINITTIIAATSNGRIDIKDENATSIKASSQNGNVNIELKQGTQFQVDATTANGHVTYQDIAMHTNIQTTTHLNGETSTGPGKMTLTLSSTNGDVTIQYYST